MSLMEPGQKAAAGAGLGWDGGKGAGRCQAGGCGRVPGASLGTGHAVSLLELYEPTHQALQTQLGKYAS